ncbi:RNA-directed DNA polymerase, eukaryota [Tanacetum coccineum]|uniref:RNA-directed DNA polymerase, eukaryota n=1 Tax=Tanacetum coccineum TaxID=301880 RepID=A0ABQ5E5M5_9ASTR
MSGKYGTSNAGAESVGVSDCNKVYKDAGNEAVMSISVDDCIDLDGMERSILAKVKDLSVISELLKHMSSEGFDDVGLRYVGGRWVWLEFDSMDQAESVKTSKALKEIFLEFKDVSHDFIPDERCVWIDLVGLPLASWAPEVYKKLGGRWGSSVFTDMVSDGPMSHGKVCVLTESLHRVIESFIVSYRNRTYRIIATEFAYWAPNIESMEVNSESNPLERKDAEGPSLDESLENEEHLDVDSCDSDSPKNVNNDSVSPSSRVLREEDVRGVESDLVDSFEEGEIRDDSVLYNDGCIKDCMEKNLEDDAGEILGVHSQGDCGNVTTDDNEDVTPVIAPEKDSIIAPPSTPPGNDLNIAVESGSSWIDYIGPLTSDEIDSDKRWSYRDPNGNIHGLFSLAQLRSWKDYFPSDLQIWSYYGNVKEAILLHNALSRQTKDAVARIEAIRLFLAYALFKDFVVYQTDVKSAFLYGNIEEKVYVCQPPRFEDPEFPDKVYKVEKALYGLHQAPRACDSERCGLFYLVKTSTPMETPKPLLKDAEAEDVDVHLYRSLMYVTASRPDIMFVICACARFQVTPKVLHLYAVKRIFRYMKGQPKLGLWYPKDSSFDLEAYTDSDYAGASLDRKSITGGCQFLGRRLISWQCKKQTIVSNSTIKVEYVAACSCCGYVLWIQNQMLDYGYNFMNTKIFIDNESTICIVKNPVFHSKTKHIEIRHYFSRDSYEKRLI